MDSPQPHQSPPTKKNPDRCSEPKRPIVESSFVTPGIFRRKMSRNMRVKASGTVANKNENEQQQQKTTELAQFQWSIDQMAVLRPVEFDESELSMPPEDWDPSAEFSRSQASAIDQFWTQNTHIAPSPDVIAEIARNRKSANNASLPQPTFCSPQDPDGSAPCTSSRCSSSISSCMMSPMMLMSRSQMFESTRCGAVADKSSTVAVTGEIKLIADGSDDFEQLERSLSFGEADSILADMDDGGFVLKNDENNPSAVPPPALELD